jgi:hypothetical protein
MKAIKYILTALIALGFSLSSTISAQNVLTTNGSVQPLQPTYSGGTIITVPYSMSFKMLSGQRKKLNIKFNTSYLQFLTTDLPAASNGLFVSVAPDAGYQIAFETTAFTPLDNNFNYGADFTISFLVKAATCIKLTDNIIADLRTTNCNCPANISTPAATTPISFLNANSGPTIAIDLLMGNECSIAMYKLTTFGLDINGSTQNSVIKLTLPNGATLLDVYNTAGSLVTFTTNGNTYKWQRSGVSSENVQIHYIVVKFNNAVLCTNPNSIYKFNADFSSFNTCNSSPANALTTTRQISGCCGSGGNPGGSPNVTIINGVVLSKTLIQYPLRYFPSPDNCKTHDYYIQVDNVTGNSLSSFKLGDLLSNITSASDEIEVTGITASFTSIIPSTLPFSFTTSPASTPVITTLAIGQTQALTVPLVIGANPVQDITINGTGAFPAYSSLTIKITHKLVNPNPGNVPYINKAGLSFKVGSIPYSGSVIWTSKKDNYDPQLAITKKVRNVTDNNPPGLFSYTNGVNVGPGDVLEFEIRIRNYGMKNIQANLSDNITEFPALNNFFVINPSSISVTDGTGLNIYSNADLNTIKNSLTSNLSSSGFFCTIQDVKAAPCNSYSELIIKYTVVVKPSNSVTCESIYTNSAKIGWMLNGVAKSDYKEAIVNIDLFKNIVYKLEATCKDPAIATPADWVDGYINGIPGKPIWYRATIVNKNSYPINMQVMVQLPNVTDNLSTQAFLPNYTSTLTSSVPVSPANANLHPEYPIQTGWWPTGVTSSNIAQDNFLTTQCTAPAASFFGRTAIYYSPLLAGNSQTQFTYKVIVSSNNPGKQYVTAMGVSRSCGTNCPMIRNTDLTLTIGQCNECGCVSGCDLITLDSKIERLPLGGNNFKVTLSNILSNGNTIDNFDIVVHQPYRDISPSSPFNKPMLPYTLGSISSTTTPPFALNQPTSGQRYYRVNSGNPVNFGNISFDIQTTLPPVVDNLIFPINIIFRDKANECTICEKMIYLKYESWNDLVQKDMLTGDDDPVDISLDSERKRLQKSKLGPDIEKWYADIKNNDGISKMVLKHPLDVIQLLKVARKLMEKGETLNEKDLTLIEKGMRMIDKEIAPAPEGLIDESLKRLRLSIGKKWDNIMENLIK